jgi:hypothetical protein
MYFFRKCRAARAVQGIEIQNFIFDSWVGKLKDVTKMFGNVDVVMLDIYIRTESVCLTLLCKCVRNVEDVFSSIYVTSLASQHFLPC